MSGLLRRLLGGAAPTPPGTDFTIEVAGRRVPVELRPRAGSGRLALRVDPARGVVRVALHPRTPAGRVLAFVEQHRDWIAARVADWPVARPLAAGARVPFRGGELLIDWAPAHPRTPRVEGERLIVGGPAEAVPGRVERWLRAEAKRVLEAETRALGLRVGREVAAVTVRDTSSRWGSCTGAGRVAYSWRLILAPDFVREAVVAHEVAHLVHLNHSDAFWTLAEELLGRSHAEARRWLKRYGPGLHWVGRA